MEQEAGEGGRKPEAQVGQSAIAIFLCFTFLLLVLGVGGGTSSKPSGSEVCFFPDSSVSRLQARP